MSVSHGNDGEGRSSDECTDERIPLLVSVSMLWCTCMLIFMTSVLVLKVNRWLQHIVRVHVHVSSWTCIVMCNHVPLCRCTCTVMYITCNCHEYLQSCACTIIMCIIMCIIMPSFTIIYRYLTGHVPLCTCTTCVCSCREYLLACTCIVMYMYRHVHHIHVYRYVYDYTYRHSP